VAGAVSLVDDVGAALHFVGNSSAKRAIVEWSGFHDDCSGVRSYNITLQSTARVPLWGRELGSDTSNSQLPGELLLGLPDTTELVLVVVAVNHAGLAVNASVSFKIDRTGPVVDGLVNGNGRNVACQSMADPMRVSWKRVRDWESGVHSVEWALGFSPFSQELQQFTRVDGDAGNVVRRWFDLDKKITEHQTVHGTLRVLNGARDATLASVPPVRVVSPNCSEPYICMLPLVGVHPMLLPLVLSLTYDVGGHVKMPGFVSHHIGMESRNSVSKA
jgi:hypothetical protein